ncbi:hypothetical protein BMF29_02305 [Comamonas kerstersii]|nr:hypothetical protein BMF38_08755 [Comamonas kerstersii]OOH95861.1 hypothetical protein BMF29_02305 [Comamonas kerstersii]
MGLFYGRQASDTTNIKELSMWKIAVAFAVFAAISLFMIFQFGDQVDMSGEKHGAEAIHTPTDNK